MHLYDVNHAGFAGNEHKVKNLPISLLQIHYKLVNPADHQHIFRIRSQWNAWISNPKNPDLG